MIVVTATTGKLGRHVVEGLLQKVPAEQIAVAVRTPAKASDLAARGVQVRRADCGRPETLPAAFAGAQKVLLVSSNEIGQRLRHIGRSSTRRGARASGSWHTRASCARTPRASSSPRSPGRRNS